MIHTEPSSNGVRHIIRIRLWPLYRRIYIGRDTFTEVVPAHFTSPLNWHARITKRAYIGISAY